MRYLVNMVYKCKGKSYLTYEAEDEAIELAKVGEVISTDEFFDKETFLSKKEEITTLCKAFNARAYFWINPRNCKEVQYEIIREALEAIELINYLNVYLGLLAENGVISINLNGYQILILRIGVL